MLNIKFKILCEFTTAFQICNNLSFCSSLYSRCIEKRIVYVLVTISNITFMCSFILGPSDEMQHAMCLCKCMANTFHLYMC